jgi:hypothetical protein
MANGGAKNPRNAKAARDGANGKPKADAPGAAGSPVKLCKCDHWIAVRVEFEDSGKLVETGTTMKLKLNNGETRVVALKKGAQPGGKYDTTKILTLTTDCEVSFPDMYDAEIRPK